MLAGQIKYRILKTFQMVFGLIGYDVVIRRRGTVGNAETRHHEHFRAVRPYTMTSVERVVALCDAVDYVCRAQIPGAFVECGVASGGSMMAVARVLMDLGETERELYLYDTFEGMPKPGEFDAASEHILWKTHPNGLHAYSLDHVRKNLETVGYPTQRLHFIKGRVEDTLPAAAPAEIALLRLDTDHYSSTLHELEHLFPRLVPGGILLLDDYGFHSSVRKAVDEYFARTGDPIFLSRIDDSGRVGVKGPSISTASMKVMREHARITRE